MTTTNGTAATRASAHRWYWAIAGVVAVCGTLLSVVAWRVALNSEKLAAKEEFQAQAAALGKSIQKEVELFENVLASITYLHAISDRITREDFEEFVVRGMRFHREILGGFGFVQVIDEAVRVLLETSETNALRIVRYMGDGRFEGVPPKGIYFPLMYQFPEQVFGVPVGFDLQTYPPYAAAIARMLDRGGPVLGGRTLRGDEEESYLVFAPILSEEPPDPSIGPRQILGFVVGVFWPERVLQAATLGLEHLFSLHGWRVVWDLSVPGESLSAESSVNTMASFEWRVPVADAMWRLQLLAAPDRMAPFWRRRSSYLLLAGVGLTALLSLELVLMAGRTRRIEKLVDLRTRALREAKEQLEVEMRRRSELEEEILNISSKEKIRVGQDLHDSLGQKLTGAMLLTGALANRAGASEREDLKSLHELLKDAVSQVRRMAKGLAPVELGERGLVGALEQLVDETQEVAKSVQCSLNVDRDFPLVTGARAEHLYHIAQEAVTNALRHSGARHVWIFLRKLDDSRLELSIRDDGRGVQVAEVETAGYGLSIMRHRADLIGAEFRVESGAGKGTQIVCRFSPH